MLGFVPQPNLRTAPLLAGNTGEASIRTANQLNLFSVPISNESAVRESKIPISRSNETWIESNRPSQINNTHGHLSYTPFQIRIPQIGISDAAITQIGISQTDPFHVTTTDNSFNHLETIQVRSSEVGVKNSRLSQGSTLEIGSTEIAIPNLITFKDNSTQISLTEISVFEIGASQVNTTQINSTEVSFPSSIPFQKLVTSYPHFYTSAITNTFKDNPLNLTLEATDLPTGQLAEAQITSYTDQGIPNGGKILIDHNANGLGWFIDPTPLDHSEFSQTLTDTALLATADSEAYGKYDLLTTILHELGHLAGFISGYNEFDRHIQTINGKKTFVAEDFTATLSPDGSHLDSEAHPHDLMNTTLRPGVRKLPSLLNLQILNALRSEGVREGVSE